MATDVQVRIAARNNFPPSPVVYTMGYVARALRVDPKTVSRWCAAGKVNGAFRTPGGHWRIPEATFKEMLGVDEQ